jgi:hypothetical protein
MDLRTIRLFGVIASCGLLSACPMGSDVDVKTVNGETQFVVTAPSCVKVIRVTQNPDTAAPQYSYSLQTSADNRQNEKHCLYQFVYGKSYAGYDVQFDGAALRSGQKYFVSFSGTSFSKVKPFTVP